MTTGSHAVPVGDVWRDATSLTRRRIAFDVTAAALYTLFFGLAEASTSTSAVVATVLLGVALALRRIWLPGMVLAAVAASVVQVVRGDVAVYADVAYFLLFFTLGAHRSRPVRRFGFGCVGVAVAVAGVFNAVTVGMSPSGQTSLSAGVGMAALAAVVAGGGWVAGFLRWQQRQAVQARFDAGVAAVQRQRLEELYRLEHERGRIAADMHDVVAHSWAVVAAQADGARYLLRADPDRAEQALAVIGDTARTAMTDVRALLAQLRDSSVDGTGSTAAQTPAQAEDVITRMRASGMRIDLARQGIPGTDERIVSTARLVLTEALTNALKHGDLTRPVEVVEDWRDGYRLRVINSLSAGTVGSHRDGGEGHGLRGMAERVAYAGGRVTSGARENQWIVQVVVPAEPVR